MQHKRTIAESIPRNNRKEWERKEEENDKMHEADEIERMTREEISYPHFLLELNIHGHLFFSLLIILNTQSSHRRKPGCSGKDSSLHPFLQ